MDQRRDSGLGQRLTDVTAELRKARTKLAKAELAITALQSSTRDWPETQEAVHDFQAA